MTSVDAHALLAQAAALRAQGKLHDAIAIYEAVLQKTRSFPTAGTISACFAAALASVKQLCGHMTKP